MKKADVVRKLQFCAEDILPQQSTVHAINDFLFLRVRLNVPPRAVSDVTTKYSCVEVV
jgi:hypothetical protein